MHALFAQIATEKCTFSAPGPTSKTSWLRHQKASQMPPNPSFNTDWRDKAAPAG
jgi:hypothetical protein